MSKTPRVLVIGDLIHDQYEWCKATRLCPEAPLPVLTRERSNEVRPGGAGNVHANLVSLGANAHLCVGSESVKRRTFAGHTLFCRVDEDSIVVKPSDEYFKEVMSAINDLQPDALIISDYYKGGMSPSLIRHLLNTREADKRIFVDAKCPDPHVYKGCFAIFPNGEERKLIKQPEVFRHVITKLGSEGCMIDGKLVPTKSQQVYDVTGAGDVFIATFVWAYLACPIRDSCGEEEDLNLAASIANAAAGLSVKQLGTFVVKREDLL